MTYRPDGKKKAYVRLTADHDALDVANKVIIYCQRYLLTILLIITLVCRSDSSKRGLDFTVCLTYCYALYAACDADMCCVVTIKIMKALANYIRTDIN